MCTLQIFNSNDSRVYNISSENIDIDSNNASIKDLNKLIHKSLGFKAIKTVISDDTARCVNVCDLTILKRILLQAMKFYMILLKNIY